MKKVVGHIKIKSHSVKSKLKSLDPKLAVLVGGVTVALVLALGLGIKQVSLSPVQRMAKQEQKARDVVRSLVSGCVSKALEDEKLAMAVMLSGGQVCFQILGKTVESEIQGKGFCSLNDAKCQFKVAYVKTAIVVSESEFSDTEVQDLETSAEAAYESAL